MSILITDYSPRYPTCRWLADREVTCHIESSTIDMPLLSLAPVEEVAS